MTLRILAAAVLCLTLFALLGAAFLQRPASVADLPAELAAALPESGVEHAITAVLLNFRSLDTLLEVGVLVLAVVVALALHEAQPDQPDGMGLANPLLRAVMAWLLPLMLLVAGYLLWAGSTRPGGAFQAGAVLAAVGVLLRLAGVRLPGFAHVVATRAVLVFGLAVFVAAGTGVMLTQTHFLEYPAAWAGRLILGIELALTLSIGLALLSLFKLAPPHGNAAGEEEINEEGET